MFDIFFSFSLYAYPRQPESSFHDDLHDLLIEAEHIHDVVLEINNSQTYPAHKYILSMRSSYFRQRLTKKQIDKLIITNDTNTPINPEMFQLILEYIYSDRCPWLNFVEKIKARDEHEYQMNLARMKSVDDDIDDHRYFARVRQQATSSGRHHHHHQQYQHENKSKKKRKSGRMCHFVFIF